MEKEEVKTQAVEKKVVTVYDLVERQAGEISKVLPSHMGGERGLKRFTRMAITTIKRTPKLAECDAASLMGVLMDCAQLGLEPDSVLGTAYILPYGAKATLIIGYRGLIQLAYRGGTLKGLSAEVVYERDTFVHILGSDPKLVHVPSEDADPGPLKYTYAVAELLGGTKIWKVLNRNDIARIKKSSRSASGASSPWVTHEPQMWLKSAIRALSKMLPLSPEFADALSKDTEGESIEVESTTRIVSPALLGDDQPPKESLL